VAGANKKKRILLGENLQIPKTWKYQDMLLFSFDMLNIKEQSRKNCGDKKGYRSAKIAFFILKRILSTDIFEDLGIPRRFQLHVQYKGQ